MTSPGYIGPSALDSGTGTGGGLATSTDDFVTAIIQSLIAEGIDPYAMDPTQLQSVIDAVENDQALQDEFNAEQSGQIGDFGITVSMSELQTAITRSLFDPTQSDNSNLLGIGLALRQQQNLPLDATQQRYLATGQATASTYGSGGYIADLAKQAGFSPDLIPTVVAIVMAESGGNPNALNNNPPIEISVGLSQINTLAHPDLAQKYDLTDPLQNLRAAFQVYQNAGNSFSPWSTYTSGAYLQYMNAGSGPFVSAQGSGATLQSLASQYPAAYSQFRSIYGRDPTLQELQSLAGMSAAQISEALRNSPSHIPGMSNGQYSDTRSILDSASMSLFGHGATDGMVADAFKAGYTSPSMAKLWLLNMDAEGKMDPQTYLKIWGGSSGYVSGVYGSNGFDPRIASYIHGQATQQGALTPQDTVDLERQWADYRKQLADYGDPSIDAQQRDQANINKTISDTAAGVF